MLIIPPPIPIGADKNPDVKPDKILINKLIFLLMGLGFSFEIRKNKEKIIVIIEKNKIKPDVFKFAANTLSPFDLPNLHHHQEIER